ncbi:MAG: DUF433 domain-containing protein [Candidatus Aminicenantes bacterium]|nr:MAG: DUF433 domain-containing protein [Candidatus Aminicenantes bacterium]
MIDYVRESEIDKQMMEGGSGETTSFMTAMVIGLTYTMNWNAIADEQSLRALSIVKNPKICNKRPIILGTRIAVSNIVELHHLLEWDIQRILEEYPYLSEEQVIAALEYYEQHTQEINKYLVEEKEINVE